MRAGVGVAEDAVVVIGRHEPRRPRQDQAHPTRHLGGVGGDLLERGRRGDSGGVDGRHRVRIGLRVRQPNDEIVHDVTVPISTPGHGFDAYRVAHGKTRMTEPAAPRDRVLLRLTYLALVLAIGHHVDHVVRGNHVGWPVTAEVNAFTYSLAIYPLILGGLFLYRRGMVGPGFWILLSGGGAVFLALIHFGPWALEPPGDIIGMYETAFIGWFAFGWLVALVAVLVIASVYELRLWLRSRASP